MTRTISIDFPSIFCKKWKRFCFRKNKESAFGEPFETIVCWPFALPYGTFQTIFIFRPFVASVAILHFRSSFGKQWFRLDHPLSKLVF